MVSSLIYQPRILVLLYFLFSVNVLILDKIFSGLTISISLIWLTAIVNFLLFNQKKDFLDPRCFFSAFFVLYHTWYPISIILGRQVNLFSMDFNILEEVVSYSLFCLLVFINVSNIVLGMFFSKFNEKRYAKNFRNLTSERLILVFALSIVFISVFFISTSDLKSKSDVNAEGGFIKLLSYYALLLSTGIVLIRMVRSNNPVYKDSYFWLFFIVTFIYVGYTGERDVVFRFLICSLLVASWKKRNFGVVKILGLIFAASIVVPISQAFKAVFIAGFVGVNFDLGTIFSNEFISTSRNLYTLIYFGGESQPFFIVSDFLRGIMPSSVTKELGIESTSQWFNSYYRVANNFDGRAGWGFGLVPQGYLVGKELGGFSVMSLSAVIINFIYARCGKNNYWFVFYLLALTVLIYAMRADLANLVSQIFKISGASILIVYFSHCFFVKLKK